MNTADRLNRIERCIAQLATGLRQGVGWRPEQNFQDELAELRDEQFEAIQREKARASAEAVTS
jgi:hypothetical protein